MSHEDFQAYLPLSDSAIQELWKSAIFVFDTNVWLSLYRFGHVTRARVIESLQENLSGRVWIPYHVAVEFYRNRPELLRASHFRIEETITKWQAAKKSFHDSIKASNLSEIGIEFDVRELASLDKAVDDFCEKLQAIRAEAPNLEKTDSVLEFFEKFVGDNIGKAPADQDELDKLLKDAEERYKNEVPPGYKDVAEKKDAHFIHRMIRYKKQYGDLIIWKQLLDAIGAGNDRFKRIILVTGDRKEDWWQKNKSGETIGPRLELRQEIGSAGAKFFHMYHFSYFLEKLAEFFPASQRLSARTIEEIQRQETDSTVDLSVLSSLDQTEFGTNVFQRDSYTPSESYGYLGHYAEAAVRHWLLQKYPNARMRENDGFPDFVLFFPADKNSERDIILGVEVKTPLNLRDMASVLQKEMARAHTWLFQKSELFLAERRSLVYVFAIPHQLWPQMANNIDGTLFPMQRSYRSIGVEIVYGMLKDNVFQEVLPLT